MGRGAKKHYEESDEIYLEYKLPQNYDFQVPMEKAMELYDVEKMLGEHEHVNRYKYLKDPLNHQQLAALAMENDAFPSHLCPVSNGSHYRTKKRVKVPMFKVEYKCSRSECCVIDENKNRKVWNRQTRFRICLYESELKKAHEEYQKADDFVKPNVTVPLHCTFRGICCHRATGTTTFLSKYLLKFSSEVFFKCEHV